MPPLFGSLNHEARGASSGFMGPDPSEEFGCVLAIPRLDAKLYFSGVKINYDEIGGHWSEVQKTQDLFLKS
jgi:hypothetical protein